MHSTIPAQGWRFAALAVGALLVLALNVAPVAAQHGPRGGGGMRAAGHAGAARATAHTSINRPVQRPQGGAVNRNGDWNANRNANRNVNRDVNRNVNRTVNRNVNVDVDYHDDHWNHWDDHPFATAAAVTAGVAVTSAVIGSIVSSVPPSCVTTVIDGMAYQQCGSTWYAPRYAGTTVQYVVINPPR
ncbi:hypothetical protein ACLB90_00690 [Stenotrophomonas sp. LGBM10]|uniref:hypothetical protein n=1 Tax=Stenotrophomonas sp. LGBM10 TaxID=3390038 RepID=UPI00398B94B2